MKLRTRFLLSIGAILVLIFGLIFYSTSAFQNDLVISQALQQARMLSRQIVLTRKWVADHSGVFLVKENNVAANPFLDEPDVVDARGRHYVKRNPAMVTRELSELADDLNFYRFRVTSLKPVNPENAPNVFERKSLTVFDANETVSEVYELKEGERGRVLQYITPLIVEQECLECHARHGYAVGDVRGGLSLEIPIAWADQSIDRNRTVLLTLLVGSMALVGLLIYLLTEFLVIRRLRMLSEAMDRYPETNGGLPGGGDEIGHLSGKFTDMGRRLSASRRELQDAYEQMMQVEKMAAIGRLSAGIAHEINNPLAGMLNCIKRMKDKPNDVDMRERYLDLLKKGLQRVENTVRHLLKFGRPERLRFLDVIIDGLIGECLGILEYKLKNMNVITDMHLDMPHSVDVDAVKQIVMNLLLNALQAMGDAGTLTIRSREEGDWIKISITDTGQGIAEDKIPKIFEPFFTTKEVGEGTGLGLAVSYSLAKRMDGGIEVKSREGEGATFTVSLPKKKGN